MDGLDVSRLSSASAKDDGRGLVPNKGGSSRRMARTTSRLGRRPASCPAGQAVGPWSAAGHGLDRRALWNWRKHRRGFRL